MKKIMGISKNSEKRFVTSRDDGCKKAIFIVTLITLLITIFTSSNALAIVIDPQQQQQPLNQPAPDVVLTPGPNALQEVNQLFDKADYKNLGKQRVKKLFGVRDGRDQGSATTTGLK